jgi:hypothetical protein
LWRRAYHQIILKQWRKPMSENEEPKQICVVGEEDLMLALAVIDGSIQPMFAVSADVDGAFNRMLQAVPEENRQSLATEFMAMQNAIMVKMGHMLRTTLKLDVNNPKLTLHSEQGKALLKEIAKEAKASSEVH